MERRFGTCEDPWSGVNAVTEWFVDWIVEPRVGSQSRMCAPSKDRTGSQLLECLHAIASLRAGLHQKLQFGAYRQQGFEEVPCLQRSFRTQQSSRRQEE